MREQMASFRASALARMGNFGEVVWERREFVVVTPQALCHPLAEMTSLGSLPIRSPGRLFHTHSP